MKFFGEEVLEAYAATLEIWEAVGIIGDALPMLPAADQSKIIDSAEESVENLLSIAGQLKPFVR